MKVPLSHLNELAASAPKYHASLIRKGRVEGDFLFIGPDKPSLATQAKNLGTAIGQAIVNPTPVSKEEQERRLAICHQCEFLIEGKRCSKCGCYVNWKSRLEAWHCPIQKW